MVDFAIFSTKSGFVKIVALLCLIVSMSTFFSLHDIEDADKDSSYFVTAMIVSPFLHTSFLLIVYVFGGMLIQKTLYEFMVNSFYTLMLLIAGIVTFTISNDDSGAIASGVFLMFAGVCYGGDSYLALMNMGVISNPNAGATNNLGPGVAGAPYPPATGAATGASYPPATGASYPPATGASYPPAGTGGNYGQSFPEEIRSQPFTPPPVYNPPPGLAGPGTYGTTTNGFGHTNPVRPNTTGDLSNSRI